MASVLTLKPQLLVYGSPGEVMPPALGFNFLSGSGWDEARKQGRISGITRIGSRSRGDKSPDMRPLILTPQTRISTTANNRSQWTRTRGAAANDALLQQLKDLLGLNRGLTFWDNKFPNPWEYRSPAFLARDEAICLSVFISDVTYTDVGSGTGNVKGHFAYFRWGVAGRGWKLQVRDGNIELLHLAPTWTDTNEHTYHGLCQLPEPTLSELQQIQDLQQSLYDTSDGLSFEGGLNRDEWRGAQWTLTIIPENRGSSNPGALHLLLDGGSQTTVDLADSGDFLDSDGYAHIPTGSLWEATPLYAGSTGGEMFFDVLSVRFGASGIIEWGPYNTGYWSDSWSSLEAEILTSSSAPSSTSATMGKVDVNTRLFKLKGTLSTTDTRYTPFAHQINATLPNGTRANAGDTTVTFDTLALEHDAQPTMEIRLSVEENGQRYAEGVWRDVNGKTLDGKSIEYLANFQASLKLGNDPWITKGIIKTPRAKNLKNLAYVPDSGIPQRGGFRISKGETTISATIDDGTSLFNDILCDPPIIFDGDYLGTAVRKYYLRAGEPLANLARISPTVGPQLPGFKPGQGWNIVSDDNSTIRGGVEGLLDRFGAGLRHGRDSNGVLYLEPVPTTVIYNFTSDGTQNDPTEIHGGTRHILLDGLEWEIDHENYHSWFTVIGGPDNNKITRTFVNRAAVTLGAVGIPGPLYRGYHKHYPVLRDEGLDNEALVLFALRSLVWRYGRPGRHSPANSYLHKDLAPWDRITADGILCEIKSWEGSIGDDFDDMRMMLREVVNVGF